MRDSSETQASTDGDDDSFVYFRQCRRPFNRLEDTDHSITYEDRTQLTDREDREAVDVLKYVDDFLGTEELKIADGYTVFSQTKPKRYVHAVGSEAFFQTVSRKAAAIGMRVNDDKTQILAISGNNEKVCTYIRTGSGVTANQDELKILGFVFGTKPTVQAHIDHLSKKFRSRIWTLRHLKKAGIGVNDLKRLYQVLVLPVLDYAAVVYHSMLTNEQTTALERLQSSALKIIYGFGHTSEALREMAEIETLWERRNRLVTKFQRRLSRVNDLAQRGSHRKSPSHGPKKGAHI